MINVTIVNFLFLDVDVPRSLSHGFCIVNSSDLLAHLAMLQTFNPITVYSYGFLFNCTTVSQASDSMTALT